MGTRAIRFWGVAGDGGEGRLPSAGARGDEVSHDACRALRAAGAAGPTAGRGSIAHSPDILYPQLQIHHCLDHLP